MKLEKKNGTNVGSLAPQMFQIPPSSLLHFLFLQIMIGMSFNIIETGGFWSTGTELLIDTTP